MITIATDVRQVSIPAGLDNLAAFRSWARSDDVPEFGLYSYLDGELSVDLGREQLFSHNQVKLTFLTVLASLIDAEARGYYFTPRVMFSHVEANVSTAPDGLFVAYESLRIDRCRFVENGRSEPVELEDTPDMVLEVVSTASVRKDTVTLRELYAKAGIAEYWLVDAREEAPRFDILRLGPRGYAATRRQAGGWLRSRTFGRAFRFTQIAHSDGFPRYHLEVRA